MIEQIYSFFNNREIAIIIWFSIFVIHFFSKGGNSSFLSSLKDLIKAFFKKKILIIFGSLILYNLFSIWILYKIGFWESYQVKNTILWFLTVATVTFFRASNIKDEHGYFKKAIADNFKIIVFIQFLYGLYTVPLLIELVFIPVMFSLNVYLAISKTDKKFLPVKKIINKLLEFIGIAFIIYIGYKLFTSFDEFAQKKTLYDFILPIALSLLLLPFMYILHVYMTYDYIFTKIECYVKDKKLCNYAKITAIIKYRLYLSALKRWVKALCIARKNVKNKSDIDELHKEINDLIIEEKCPPAVPYEMGWSPCDARKFLEEKGLKTEPYKKGNENEWFAESPPMKILDGISSNYITYCIEGNKKDVTYLKLEMIITKTTTDKSEHAPNAHSALYEIASVLHLNATGLKIGENFKNAILDGGNVESSINSKIVKVVTKNYPSGGHYEVVVTIENV